jgi:hypothetical protein
LFRATKLAATADSTRWISASSRALLQRFRQRSFYAL